MLLAVDVGNSQIVCGVFSETVLVCTFRIGTEAEKSVDQYALEVLGLLELHELTQNQIQRVVVSCVVPPLRRVFLKLAAKYFRQNAIFVDAQTDTGLVMRLENPTSVGADRIVNAVAAKALFSVPAVIVDFGTATTFDVLDSDGVYVGGVIAPGVVISAEALTARTAQLPAVDIRRPNCIIGKNTIEAMQSGIFFGYIAAVDGIVKQIAHELGASPRVIATGGLARLFASEGSVIESYVPDLTLQGLRIVSERLK